MKKSYKKGTKRRYAPRSKSSKKRYVKRGPLKKKRRIGFTPKQMASYVVQQNIRWYDVMKVLQNNPAGGVQYTGFGLANTSLVTSPYSFTSSPEDLYYLAAVLASNPQAALAGRTKFAMKSWYSKWNITNPNNFPMEIALIELICKKDIPAVWNWGYAAAQATGLGTINAANTRLDFSFESWWNSQMGQMTHPVLAGSNAISDLSGTNPNAPNSAGSVTPAAIITQPGVRLTDLANFRKFFRIKKVSKRVVQPGAAAVFARKCPRPYVMDTRDWFTSSSWGNATYAQTAANYNIKLSARAGQRHFVFRMIPRVGATSVGGSTTHITYPAGSIICIQEKSIVYNVLQSPNDSISFNNALSTDAVGTSTVIFPGTSTKGVTAPAV